MLNKMKDGVTSILSKFSKDEVDDTVANVHVITIPVVFNVGKLSEKYCNYLLKRNHSDTIRTLDVIGRSPSDDDILDNPVLKNIILPWSLFDSGITFEMLQEAAVGMPTAFYFNDRNFSWYGDNMWTLRNSDDPYIKHLVKIIDTSDDKFVALCAFVSCLTILHSSWKKAEIFDHVFPQYRYFPEDFKEMNIEFMIRGFVLPPPEKDETDHLITDEERSDTPVEKDLPLNYEQKLEYIVTRIVQAGENRSIIDKMLLLFTALRLKGISRAVAVKQTLDQYNQTDKRTLQSISNAWAKQSETLLSNILPEILPLPNFAFYSVVDSQKEYIDQAYKDLIKRA